MLGASSTCCWRIRRGVSRGAATSGWSSPPMSWSSSAPSRSCSSTSSPLGLLHLHEHYRRHQQRYGAHARPQCRQRRRALQPYRVIAIVITRFVRARVPCAGRPRPRHGRARPGCPLRPAGHPHVSDDAPSHSTCSSLSRSRSCPWRSSPACPAAGSRAAASPACSSSSATRPAAGRGGPLPPRPSLDLVYWLPEREQLVCRHKPFLVGSTPGPATT